MEMFFLLIVGHALADFVFQDETMSKAKSRDAAIHKETGEGFPAWWYWLSAHALVHGGAVYLITGSLWFGVLETLLHWFIDYLKCEHRINLHQDQALHMVCKVGYCLAL